MSRYDSPIRSFDDDDTIPTVAVREEEQFSNTQATVMVNADLGGSNKAAGPKERTAGVDDPNGLETERPEAPVDAVFWPAEVVFVPTNEEVEEDEVPVDLPHFEDAQADDVFEQSLSGLRLSDLEPVDATTKIAVEGPLTDEREAPEPSEPVPLNVAEDIAVETPVMADVGEPMEHIVPVPVDAVDVQAEVEPKNFFPEPGPISDRRKWTHTISRAGVILVVAAAVFTAGVGTGIWIAPKPLLVRPPKPAEIIPSETKTQDPSPPPGMAYVPGGSFIMGSDKDDEFSRPSHPVTVGPFFVDLTEVTNEDYLKFVIDTGYRSPTDWKGGAFPVDKAKFPVTGVTWFDAADYAEWAGKRLPTEEEWEFAARGTDGRKYPWGNDWDPKLANAGDRTGGPRRVGEGGTSPFGLFDMSGNAWEWTASDAVPFPGGKTQPKSRLKLKIIRGGNWLSDSSKATTVFRGYYGASGEAEYRGTSFRCVKDISRD